MSAISVSIHNLNGPLSFPLLLLLALAMAIKATEKARFDGLSGILKTPPKWAGSSSLPHSAAAGGLLKGVQIGSNPSLS